MSYNGKSVSRSMKKFVARFYLVSVLAVVLVTELLWVAFVCTGHENRGSSLTTRLLFPVLFLVGTVQHFRSR
jgi:hypothetical protein